MNTKVILGGLVGGVVLFIWGAIAWMVLPLHTPTIKSLPNEDAVRAMLTVSGIDQGLYYFPNYPHGQAGDKDAQAAAMKAFEEKHRSGPLGMLVYQPNGAEPMEPKVFAVGFVIDVVFALIAAWLLARAGGSLGSYGARVQFVTVLGAFGALVVNLSYWNWWRFPTDYTIGMVADGVIGWFLVGLALAAIVKRPAG